MEMEGMAPQLHVAKISAVAPALPTQTHSMFLPNLDLMWLPIGNVQRLLFYRIPPLIQNSSVLHTLKDSLSAVLVHFYPLAGRLRKGEDGRVEVHCNDEGVEFIEASADIAFDDLEKEGFEHKPFFENLVGMAHLSVDGDFSKPLLSVQVTAFEGGGICIGTTLQHVIADGNSFWHFMKSWAESSRGLPLSDPPLHNRTFFKRESKRTVPISLLPQQISGGRVFKFMPTPSDSSADTLNAVDAEESKEVVKKWVEHETELVYSTFHFTEEKIQLLKQKTGASSSFVAVAAQFWRSIMKARQVPDEEMVYFGVLADCRRRVKPPLPPTYFGNCISIGIVETSAKKLKSENVRFAAQVIKAGIDSCTEEVELNHFMEWLESLEAPERACPALFTSLLGRFRTTVASSPRFPVYEIDYGWGRPLNVRIASMNDVGGMVLFGEREEGGIAVSTRLPPRQMEKLAELIFD